jgi:hypothetical protein
MPEFVREQRYFVFKISDIQKMVPGTGMIDGMRLVEETLNEVRAQADKPPLECVVIESDWPEYELVWDMIESRMTGAVFRSDYAVLMKLAKLFTNREGDHAPEVVDTAADACDYFNTLHERIAALRTDALFTIGPYELSWRDDQTIWLAHKDGEGMQTTPAKLQQVLQDFYMREF